MKIRIPLKLSLIILPLVPFAAFLIVSLVQFQSNLTDLSTIGNQARNSAYLTESSELIYLLQKERGLSASMLSSGSGKADVESARSDVDALREHIGATFSNTSFYSKDPDALENIRTEIDVVRTGVDGGNLGFSAVMEEYSSIVADLFELNVTAAQEKTTGGIGKLFSSINVLQDSQESAGRMRGWVSAIAASDEAVTEARYLALLADYNAIRVNLNSRAVMLSSDSAALREDLMTSAGLSAMDSTVQKLTEHYSAGGYGISQQKFWEYSSEVVDGIHEIIGSEINLALNKNEVILNRIRNAFYTQLTVLIGTFLIVLVLSIFLIINIARRLQKVTARLEEMSSGSSDLTAEITTDVKDDIGKLVLNFNSYVASLKDMIKQIQDSAVGLTEIGRDLSVQVEETGNAKTYISDNLKTVQENVDQQVSGMDKLSAGIDVFTNAISELSGAIDEQVAAVTESSASIEEMIANIKTVTKNVDNTTSLINELDNESRLGGELIGQVTTDIGDVSEQSAALQEANELISGIADQTNLLAMNAAIEAAHAGDAGKGFSVVADEIRRLAETSSEQSRMISMNIQSILGAIESVVGSVGNTEKSFFSIIEKIKEVSMLQEGIRGAMSEQNHGSNEILTALSSLHENSRQVTESSERMSGTGNEMGLEVKHVKTATDNLQDSVKSMSDSVVQIEAVIDHIAGIVRQNEGYVEGLNDKTNRFILE